MLIYEALKNDHKKLKELLNQLNNLASDDQQKHDLVKMIRDELIPHSRAEEMVFYNALRSLEGARDLVSGSYKAHMEAETLLRSLQVRDKIDVEWKETALKLKRVLDEHIQDEEDRIIPGAQKHLQDEEAKMMTVAFEKLKPQIKKESFMGTTVDLFVNLMPPRFTNAFRKNDLGARL